MSEDTALLRSYADTGSENAFRELVERHISMVNATARRLLAGDVHRAQDVTQAVFTDLARKAASLPGGTVLGGWLYRHTCYLAANAIRSEIRRRTRERTAMEINALNDNAANDAQWQQLAPVLDEALNNLGANDRDAIVLRYLEGRDLGSIGRATGASEDAAQKRIARALEKMRDFLTRRGMTLSTALLATTLDAGASTMPPLPALVSSVSTHALSGATVKTGFTLTTLHNMITSKLAIGTATVVILAGLTFKLIPQNHSSTPTPTVNAKPIRLAAPPAPSQLPVVVTLTPPSESPVASVRDQIQAQTNAIMASGQNNSSNTGGYLTFGPAGAPAAPAGFAPPPAPPPPAPSMAPGVGFNGARFGGGSRESADGTGIAPKIHLNSDNTLTIEGANGNGDVIISISYKANTVDPYADGAWTMTITENGVTTTNTGYMRDITTQYVSILRRLSTSNDGGNPLSSGIDNSSSVGNNPFNSGFDEGTTNSVSPNGNTQIAPPPVPQLSN